MLADLPAWARQLISLGTVIVLAALATWILRVFLRRLTGRIRGSLPKESPTGKRAETLGSVLGAVGVVMIWLIALVMVLELGGVPVGPLIATAGIGGVALGFGMQNLVRDCVAGLFILAENQYDVGDSVSVAGVEGTVEAITLRSTVLRGQDGARHVVSNGEIRVSSNTTRSYSRALVTIPVGHEADIDRAIAVMRRVTDELAAEHREDGLLTGPPTVLGVAAVTPTGTDLSCFVETPPGRQFALARDLRRRLIQAFRDEGVPLAGEPPPPPPPPPPRED